MAKDLREGSWTYYATSKNRVTKNAQCIFIPITEKMVKTDTGNAINAGLNTKKHKASGKKCGHGPIGDTNLVYLLSPSKQK